MELLDLKHLNPKENEPPTAKSKFHSKHKEGNNIDPDEGNSRLCSACNLPIFATPSQATESGSGYLHDQCSNLPIDLDGSDSHPSLEPLQKQPNLRKGSCSNCDAPCGDVLYRCRGPECGFQLDVKCALTVKILHWSHDHRLMVIRCSASFACCACGTGHRPGLSWAPPMPLVYVCGTCGFWLHPHCAALPNVIEHQCHNHPLLLNYRRWSSSCQCAICGKVVSSWGVYSCTMCEYYVHIMCAVTERQSFKSVLLREAFRDGIFPHIVNFPVPDEYTSIVRHITKNTPTTSDGKLQHKHPLTLHRKYPIYKEADDEVDWPPTCNACIQFISPPFYKCSRCPKLFLHYSCARLPSVLTQNSGISLKLIEPQRFIKQIRETTCCRRNTNGFIYHHNQTWTDVLCALMPTSITHAEHATTHVLLRSSNELEACRCCGGSLSSGISYKCGTCRNFSIHGTCARLPATVRHVCDPHPLKLVTAPPPRRLPQIYCDACEGGLDETRWYYGCAECEQAFHVECVPCLDKLSLVKYEITEMFQIYHECRLTLVRVHMVCGRRCGKCGKGYVGHRDSLALACFRCNFSIHASCADNLYMPLYYIPWGDLMYF